MHSLSFSGEPTFPSAFVSEPLLQFGRGRLVDPKTGLALHGPFDIDDPARRATIRIGIIGTGLLVDLTSQWMERCRGTVLSVRRRRQRGHITTERLDPAVAPAFPGIGEVFEAAFVVPAGAIETLTAADVEQVRRIEFFEPRVTTLVEIVVRRIRVLAERPSPPDVVIVALPTELRTLCTVASRHRSRTSVPPTLAARIKKSLERDEQVGQGNMFDIGALHGLDLEVDSPQDEQSVFHHGLKAKAMATDMPTQLVWQTTLEGSPSVEDDATRAWNFWTGMYYKSKGVPWRVLGLTGGTCFVGVSFYRDRAETSLRTCMAQAFSDQGEGLVLRGEPFKWEGTRSPHLPRSTASDLVRTVLAAYSDFLHQKPSRVVIHKWSRYETEELAGFKEALDGEVHSYDLVAFGDRGIRLFRTGAEPPLRGTVVVLGPGNAILYTQGYVPFVRQYWGMRVPRPLEIVEHFGSAPLLQICAEILALSKMDFNSAAFAGREPITTAFSRDVGQILAQFPMGVTPKTLYRFYM